MVKAPIGSPIISKFLRAKKKALVDNNFNQVASPTAPRTVPAGKGVGKSGKTPKKAGAKTTDKTSKKAAKVSKAKLNTTPKTPFNRSTRVNYRQLRGR